MTKEQYTQELTRLETIIKHKTRLRLKYDVDDPRRVLANDSLFETLSEQRVLRRWGKKEFGEKEEGEIIRAIKEQFYRL